MLVAVRLELNHWFSGKEGKVFIIFFHLNIQTIPKQTRHVPLTMLGCPVTCSLTTRIVVIATVADRETISIRTG